LGKLHCSRGDAEGGERLLRMAARAGSAEAASGFVRLTLAGRCPRDEEADEWIRIAAEDGDSLAMKHCGKQALRAGDAETARLLLIRLHNEGDSASKGWAAGELGLMMDERNGDRVPLLRESADRGDRRIAIRLAEIYNLEIGVKPDHAEAAHYRDVAQAGWVADSRGIILPTGLGPVSSLSASDREFAVTRARVLLAKAAASDCPVEISERLGDAAESGDPVARMLCRLERHGDGDHPPPEFGTVGDPRELSLAVAVFVGTEVEMGPFVPRLLTNSHAP
jgi:hypothetical protein